MLTASNAVIITASVQVKTLTVAGKQVTLAVFRQLIEEDIWDWQARALRGVAWGHVRYLIEESPDVAINLVWQRGDELRRCKLYRRIGVDRYSEESGQGMRWRVNPHQRSQFLESPVFPGASPSGSSRRYEESPTIYTHDGLITAFGYVAPDDLDPQREFPVFEEKSVARGADEPWHDWSQRREAARAEFNRPRDIAIEAYRQEAREKWRATLDQISARYDEYERIVGPLFDLPQLFIAV